MRRSLLYIIMIVVIIVDNLYRERTPLVADSDFGRSELAVEGAFVFLMSRLSGCLTVVVLILFYVFDRYS